VATKDPKLAELMKQKVRVWALKKMAAQFNNHKKRLWNAYIKAGRKAPEFNGSNESLWDHWDSFVEYKESELGKLRSAKNKKNAWKIYITIQWVQVATRLPSLSGIWKRPPCEKKPSGYKQKTIPLGQEIGYLGMGVPTTRKQEN
jgi:hypothetical protein